MDGGTTVNCVEDKAKIATDKGYMPYMEMKSSKNFHPEKEDSEAHSKTTSRPKQNKEGYGLSLQLGEEYERKKQKLKEELRLDYRRYVAEKREFGAGEAFPQPQTQSVLIRERRSGKDKLRDDRIGENELFLRGQEETQKIRKTAKTPQAPGRDLFGSTATRHTLLSPELRGQKSSPSPERLLFSRRDVGTVTEPAVRAAPRPPRKHWEETVERWDRRPRRRYSTEEELDSEEEQEELELLQKSKPRNRQEPAQPGRRERRLHHTANRVAQERREVEVPTVNEEEYQEENNRTPLATFKTNVPAQARATSKKNMADFATGLMIGAAEEEEATQRRKARYRQELLEQMAEQRKNKRKEKELELRVAATGAIDPEKQYVTDCLTGLPQPDRIKQFGAVRREYEGRRRDVPYRPGLGLDTLGADSDRKTQEEKSLQGLEEKKEPPERPRVAFQSPILEYSAALGHLANAAGPGFGAEAGAWQGVGGITPFSEDFQKGLSGTLGEMVSPRVTGVPPPLAPALSEVYSTPYDDAYYYYGARNPLDPNLNYYGPPAAAVPSLPNLPSGAHTSILQPPAGLLAQSTSQHGVALSGMGIGMLPPDRHQQPKENALSYKEALKQQIEERQERRRREREERDHYDAKLEAEMKVYEPWGRGGGGAPLRDDRGNLISDLKRMHRTNEEAYMNPESRGRRATEPAALIRAISRAEDKDPAADKVPGFTFTQPSPYARGNVFTDRPTPQQLHEQEKYKESLKQQIEEKRRMDAERRERLRLEEEREEKRLAEQRARIQREYEEEQEKKKRKEMEQSAKNQEIIRQAEERRKEAEVKRKEEEAKESEAVRQQYERERQARLEQDHRSESPPIPAVQKRLGYQPPPRPPSLDSQRSAAILSASSLSTPRSPPVPARRNQIRATEEQQGVISELSVLRRRLRSEQRRLEGQLLQSDREDTQSPMKSRDHPPLDVFDMARLRMQVPARRPPSNTRPINTQNIEDFNQLKYRDSESREQVRQAYPDPPSDEASLELQQQALLREQQRRLNNMRRARVNDYFDLSSPMKPPNQRKERRTEEAERHSLLQSESAFIDANGYSFSTTPQPERRAGQSSARERRRQARTDFDDGLETPSRERNGQSLGSASSFQLDRVREHNQRRMRALDDMSAQGWRSGEISADEEDDLWQQTPSPAPARRVSTTTVATEPWLRPGTTETLKRLMAGRRPSSRGPLNREWEGPSTYHG
ncbi:centrosome and spindle pole-associated protein 1 isoform X2 [Colossoma macropomum]|uniref:centrosome and spindle pole-associated protein 1 isoform X2 n=1 Tax=Colossoma macropomum TaxID=42526 RepID=UPI001864D93D|nr:centrosome and spindle pole-associated protein 1 isoform X2 [Colossoma macropomum]